MQRTRCNRSCILCLYIHILSESCRRSIVVLVVVFIGGSGDGGVVVDGNEYISRHV